MKNYVQMRSFYAWTVAVLLLGFSTLQANPTQITNWTELDAIRGNLSGSFVLANDLDENTAGYSSFQSGEGWLPIGDDVTPFTGTFDGDGHTIKGLMINRTTPSNGLFGRTSDATIRDLFIKDADVTVVASGAGILAGWTTATVITNVHVSGTLTQIDNGDAVDFGGAIGRMRAGQMSNSSASVEITTVGRFVGGLVGTVTSFDGGGATIRESFSRSNIDSQFRWIGGIAGQFGGSSLIQDSYSIGDIKGTTQVGGLVGFHWRASRVINSYAVGAVVGEDEVGGISGHMDPPQGEAVGIIENSYWNTEVSGVNDGVGFGDPSGANARTSAEMRDQANYVGWDFNFFWGIDADRNDGYPYLLFELVTSVEDGIEIPTAVMLDQNFPNPFNPATTIQFTLPMDGQVTLRVYDLTGRLVTELANGVYPAGTSSVRFNAANLSSGVYMYELTALGQRQTRMMTLLK